MKAPHKIPAYPAFQAISKVITVVCVCVYIYIYIFVLCIHDSANRQIVYLYYLLKDSLNVTLKNL